MKKLILIAGFLGIAQLASAKRIDCIDCFNSYKINVRYHAREYNDCVSEYYTKLSEKESVAKACHQSQPLRLAWTTKNYPNLRENPRRVQFWEGAYSKTLKKETKYLRELVNTCKGTIISQLNVSDYSWSERSSALINVNLQDSVSESFMLLPMTQTEAQQELGEALQRCLVN